MQFAAQAPRFVKVAHLRRNYVVICRFRVQSGVLGLERVFSKECPFRSVLQKCPFRSVQQECQARVASKSVKQECQERVSKWSV